MTTRTADERVGRLMTQDPIVVDPETAVATVEQLLKTYRVGGLPVVAGGEVVGVISQTDITTARSSEMIGDNWDRLLVRHLMTTPAVTIHASGTVRWAAREMLRRHIHRLVVLGDDGAPVGVVTPLDLLRSLVDNLDVGDDEDDEDDD